MQIRRPFWWHDRTSNVSAVAGTLSRREGSCSVISQTPQHASPRRAAPPLLIKASSFALRIFLPPSPFHGSIALPFLGQSYPEYIQDLGGTRQCGLTGTRIFFIGRTWYGIRCPRPALMPLPQPHAFARKSNCDAIRHAFSYYAHKSWHKHALIDHFPFLFE